MRCGNCFSYQPSTCSGSGRCSAVAVNPQIETKRLNVWAGPDGDGAYVTVSFNHFCSMYEPRKHPAVDENVRLRRALASATETLTDINKSIVASSEVTTDTETEGTE